MCKYKLAGTVVIDKTLSTQKAERSLRTNNCKACRRDVETGLFGCCSRVNKVSCDQRHINVPHLWFFV